MLGHEKGMFFLLIFLINHIFFHEFTLELSTFSKNDNEKKIESSGGQITCFYYQKPKFSLVYAQVDSIRQLLSLSDKTTVPRKVDVVDYNCTNPAKGGGKYEIDVEIQFFS